LTYLTSEKKYLYRWKYDIYFFAWKMRRRSQSILYAVLDLLFSGVAWTLFCLVSNKIQITDGTALLTTPAEYITGVVFIPLFWVFLFMLTGFYVASVKRSRVVEFIYSIAITIPGVIILFFILLLRRFITDYSSVLHLLEVFFILQFTLTYFPRLIHTSSIARKVHKGLIGFNSIIIGSDSKALEIFKRIKTEKITVGNFLIGYVSINEDNSGKLRDYLPYLGQFADLPQIIAQNKIEEVIIAIEGNERTTVETIINILNYSEVTIKAIPSLYDILAGRVKQTAIFGTPLIEIPNQLMPYWQANIKLIMDYSISIFSLILLTPLMLILAVLIKFSGKGPVIYSQERIGKNGKPFMIYKFRSMRNNSETGEPLLSSKNDNRVTGIGHFMRKHRLDEIPNFINVIKGEMSLVGPRPERLFFIDQIIRKAPHYRRLYKVTPGITSWGQVKYGYASNVDEMIERLEYDLLYLDNMSLLIDIKIIIYTLIIIIKGKGL
jgi:exopolysaccharide biosynthesis polyprenyl glycosylphosphotransferase